MQKLIIRNKKYLLFTLIIFIIGLLIGVFYYYFLNIEYQNNIISTIKNIDNFRYNFIIKDLVIMSILFVSSFFIVGIPLSFFYLFYESFAIGFILNIFFITFKLTGLLYIIIFIIVNKIITLLIKIIFLKKNINISRYIVGLIIYKNDLELKNKIYKNIKSSLILIVIILLLNTILYIISPVIFKNLAILL